MKILRISLKNIASLAGLHTVDFTREPLASSGLFAICGPTGSGKSTLLDALCVSLYEKTPRLNAVKGTVKLPDGAKDELSQKDPANLLRRGTGDGFTEVAFQGVDGLEYTARWIVRRARNNPAGPIQTTEVALFRGNLKPGAAGQLEQGGKKTEVHPVIAQKVGLSFEQFTRAVLLAQNDFATFLKASDTDRAEILQALTGTSRFEAISKAVYSRCAEKDAAIQHLTSELKGGAPMQAEQRLELEKNLEGARTELSVVSAGFTSRLRHKQWFSDLAGFKRLVKDAEVFLEQSKANYSEAHPRRQNLTHAETISREVRTRRSNEIRTALAVAAGSESLAKLALQKQNAYAETAAKKARFGMAEESLVRARKALKSLEPDIKEALALDAQILPLLNHQKEAEERFQASLKELKTARNLLGEKEAHKTALEVQISQFAEQSLPLSHWKPFLQDRAAWIERVRHAVEANKAVAIAAKENLLFEKDAAARVLLENDQSAQQQLLAKAVADFSQTLFKTEEAASKHDPGKIIAARNQNTDRTEALQRLQLKIQAFDNIQCQTTTLENEIVALEKALSEASSRAIILERELVPEATLFLKAAQQAQDLVAATVEKTTVGLREKLEPGRPCPVCGSEVHPFADHAPTAELLSLQALRQNTLEHEKKLQRLTVESASVGNAIDGTQRQITQKTALKSNHLLELETMRGFAPESEEIATLWGSPEHLRPEFVVRQLQGLRDEREKINAAETAAREASFLVQKTLALKTSAERNLRECENDLARLRVDSAVAHTRLKEARAASNTCLQVYTAKLEALESLWRSEAAAKNEFEKTPEAFAFSFQRDLGVLSDIVSQSAEYSRLQGETIASILPLASAVALAEATVNVRRLECEGALESYTDKLQVREKLLDGTPAETVQRQLGLAIEVSEKLERECRLALETGEAEVADIATQIKLISDRVAALQKENQTATLELDHWVENFSHETGQFFARVKIDAILELDDRWFIMERSELNTLEGLVQRADGALQTHVANLQKHQELRPTLDDEAVVLSDIPNLEMHQAEKQAACEHWYAEVLNDDRRRDASAEITSRINTLTQEADPWRKLNDLIGSFDGAKFRNIAQRRTLDILLGYANAQLDLLATRYRLERIPQSLNLLVIDRDMADDQRSVHSLSGGESFLVSLALALGLASLTSNRLRIESLFIDEGFGSLDPETLATATNALMHLQSQGRKVGVISHVSEMAEAISVQIRIVKGRGGASRIEVPGAEKNLPLEDATLPDWSDQKQISTVDEMDPEVVSRQILELLRRAQSGGNPLVSTAELRKTIGCSKPSFDAGRALAHPHLLAEGRSLRLQPL